MSLKIEKLLTFIQNSKMSPNDYFYLLSIQNKVKNTYDLSPGEIQRLRDSGYLKEYQLTPAGRLVLEAGESIVNSKTRPTKAKLVNSDAMVKEYLECFPNIVLPSSKKARVSPRVISECFAWFLANHTYSWETILKATRRYVKEYELKDYMYMKTSQYFVKKLVGGITTSELAEYCDLVESGIEEENNNHFSENVV